MSGQSGREDDSRGFMGAIGKCLESVAMCPPYSNYETAPGKAHPPTVRDAHADIRCKAYPSVPSTTGYSVTVSRAYSADILSPVNPHVSEYTVAQSPGPDQSGLFDMQDPAHAAQLQNYPALQPVSHFDAQPTTSPETMVYPTSINADQSFLKSETSPVFMKSESASQGFRAPQYHSGPTPFHPGQANYAHANVPRSENDSYIRQDLVNYHLPPPYHIQQNCAHADGLRSEQVDHCQAVPQGSGLEVVLPNHKPPSTKRGPFKNPEKRQQTAHVRKIGSCIRCRMQRIRVGEANESVGYPLTSKTSAKATLTLRMTMMLHAMAARKYLPTQRSTVFPAEGGRLLKLGSSNQARSKVTNGHAAGKTAPLLGLISASGQAPKSSSLH